MKQAEVFINSTFAGILTEDDMGYEFRYDTDYLVSDKAEAVSLTLPLTDTPWSRVCKQNCLWILHEELTGNHNALQ